MFYQQQTDLVSTLTKKAQQDLKQLSSEAQELGVDFTNLKNNLIKFAFDATAKGGISSASKNLKSYLKTLKENVHASIKKDVLEELEKGKTDIEVLLRAAHAYTDALADGLESRNKHCQDYDKYTFDYFLDKVSRYFDILSDKELAESEFWIAMPSQIHCKSYKWIQWISAIKLNYDKAGTMTATYTKLPNSPMTGLCTNDFSRISETTKNALYLIAISDHKL